MDAMTDASLRPQPADASLRPAPSATALLPKITAADLRRWNALLASYKSGKRSLDSRVQDAERWWKLRNRFQAARELDSDGSGFRASSSWLHNVIASKHADAVAAYPVPNILPRGPEDRTLAELLSRIVPVVLRQNNFDDTYDMVSWQKLKTGTGVYKVIWDSTKLWGLGDISITRRDLLSLFWEPGICDIQDSPYIFDVEMVDREEVLRLAQSASPTLPVTGDTASNPASPDLGANLTGFTPAPMPTDDRVPTHDKLALIDVYYRRNGLLHYCKYFDETLIYATENDPLRCDTGLYDHGLYPFVFDPLFPVEGSPAGYGYVDLCANSQIRIDLLTTALLRNALSGATPRYFTRLDGGINTEELLNLENTLVHVNGSLGEDYIRTMPSSPLSGNYISVLDRTVTELRETSGNTETATGAAPGGVTAASAIAALQDAAGKGSRASNASAYRAYAKLVNLVIELIRQFYSAPRRFRIAGPAGLPEFVTFDNSALRVQPMDPSSGMERAFRLPVFDIDVEPEKKSSYSKLAMNELALQLYSAGFFNPAMAEQSLKALDMMDFTGRESLRRAILDKTGDGSLSFR